MKTTAHSQKQAYIPIQSFRARWGLPDDFSLAHFETKSWEGLGSIEGTGQTLGMIKEHVLEAVPSEVMAPNLLDLIETLRYVFQRELEAANSKVGLRPAEFDFAVSGFYDILQAVAYQLLQLSHTSGKNVEEVQRKFDFSAFYQSWLEASAGIYSTCHHYEHNDRKFEVHILYNAYGRTGLQVQVGDEIFYVTDMTLACPASNFMRDLCREVAKALCRALTLAG